MNLLIFTIIISSVFLSSLAQIFLRKTMLTAGPLPSEMLSCVEFGLNLLTNIWFILGMGCYIISIVLWLGVLSNVEVSLAYPFSSLGFILTAIIGYFFLQENLNIVRIIGLGFICIGIIIISRSTT